MLQQTYSNLQKELMLDLNKSNALACPRLVKIVVAMGVGKHKDSESYINEAKLELAQITGQAPAMRRARKAISGFKLRKGEIVGLQVTLRGARMWAFLERFISTALPRVRDFRGISLTGFDSHGNYSIGITEHQIFPEIDSNKLKQPKSLQITLVTQPGVTDSECETMLTKLGMPFEKGNKNG
ncbi:50S ribosomal protein L5 [candidate division WWE3 bacterium RIFCSPLOWO2_01_FULL_42_11]|uniref:Large ribosomal subunit protein uL5 n=1 Tax=candidate division WWE3 bacterium RIFCSPLOWO2_01_FULL_42_11 TaxID=1802627 RepID=A0A1F4VRE3_UNCKA|nr:MAG: 50S ribosomal protein L5 [candidate division WWE3 bacterium RIFCSPLOWO2_01_FULL_42_11]